MKIRPRVLGMEGVSVLLSTRLLGPDTGAQVHNQEGQGRYEREEGDKAIKVPEVLGTGQG